MYYSNYYRIHYQFCGQYFPYPITVFHYHKMGLQVPTDTQQFDDEGVVQLGVHLHFLSELKEQVLVLHQ